MKKILSLSLILVSVHVLGQQKHVCITVDDLPTVTNGVTGYDFRLEITQGLIDIFTTYSIPAIGYVNEGKVYNDGLPDSMEVKLLELWLENGLELGNHSFSHFNYHQVPFEEYTRDILRGEEISGPLSAQYNKEFRYFRHPYLRIGRDRAHYDSLRQFLNTHGYTEAPVTIDNTDYLFAAAYSKAYISGDDQLMKKIGADYLDYMEQKLLYYELQSQKLFGRHIAQTLLVHANFLNARYLDDLIERYQHHGYTFVSQSEVLLDPAYAEEITVFGEYGISWLDRWALSQGYRGDFFRGDPETPGYIERWLKE